MFVWNDDAQPAGVWVLHVFGLLVLAPEQVHRRWIVLVELGLGRVIRTPLDHLLDVFRFHVDRHGPDDRSGRRVRTRLESDRARTVHTHVQFRQGVRILRKLT